MEYFAGLDVSMEETHLCVVDRDGKVILEARTPTAPRQSPPPWQKGRPSNAFCSRRDAWPQCSFMA
jgi:hypothetical protein